MVGPLNDRIHHLFLVSISFQIVSSIYFYKWRGFLPPETPISMTKKKTKKLVFFLTKPQTNFDEHQKFYLRSLL